MSSRSTSADRLLRVAAARGATELFVPSQARPYARVGGDIRPIDTEPPLSAADVDTLLADLVPEASREAARRGDATEWTIEVPDLGRIRGASFRDQRGVGAIFHFASARVASVDQLGLSPEAQTLATEPDGLVLIAGPRGSGRSAIVSAFVDTINRQRADYVITLEAQVGLLHDSQQAFISQRGMPAGAAEAAAMARAALLENPDVLVVDDLDSPEMAALVLDAAAQERLVLASITAPSTSSAVERFVDLAPSDPRAAVRSRLAQCFRGAVAQVLVRKTNGGRLAVRELMLGSAEVSRVIHDGQLGDLPRALEAGQRFGMTSLTDTLVGHVQGGLVDMREAYRKAPDRDRLMAGLKAAGVNTTLLDRLA